MTDLPDRDPAVVALVDAIHAGATQTVDRMLVTDPHLAKVGIVDACGVVRTPLHIVTDWPGHFPNGPGTVQRLVEAGADVNARVRGAEPAETPLHWAASSDDVAVLDALLDAGADIDAPGGVIAGSSPLADAVAFGQWNAARRLTERGATTSLREAAALGQLPLVVDLSVTIDPDGLDDAFWYACHGNQLHVAHYLHSRGATIGRLSPWDGLTPLQAAERTGPDGDTARWLRSIVA